MSIKSEMTTESKARMNGTNNAFNKAQTFKDNLGLNTVNYHNQSKRIKEKKPLTGKITSEKRDNQ